MFGLALSSITERTNGRNVGHVTWVSNRTGRKESVVANDTHDFMSSTTAR